MSGRLLSAAPRRQPRRRLHRAYSANLVHNPGITEKSNAKYFATEPKASGDAVDFYQSDDTHGWPGFRFNFIQFAQAAFRSVTARY